MITHQEYINDIINGKIYTVSLKNEKFNGLYFEYGFNFNFNVDYLNKHEIILSDIDLLIDINKIKKLNFIDVLVYNITQNGFYPTKLIVNDIEYDFDENIFYDNYKNVQIKCNNKFSYSGYTNDIIFTEDCYILIPLNNKNHKYKICFDDSDIIKITGSLPYKIINYKLDINNDLLFKSPLYEKSEYLYINTNI